MNTNEHEYYFRSDKLFCSHFLASIREHSCSFVAKILPGPGNGHKQHNPLAPVIFKAATSETKRRAADEERARRAEAALGIAPIKNVFDFTVEAQTETVVDRQRVRRDKVCLHVAVENVERVEGGRRERGRVMADGREVERQIDSPADALSGDQREEMI